MTSALRRFPFPYSHVITFDSDVDRQEPWHGSSIHRLLNERLGLSISDSCWPMAVRPGRSSFFVGAELNEGVVSEEQNQVIWRLLLREWHRGNIDHFHSWFEDSTYVLRYPQSGSEARIPAPPAKVGSAIYRVLRVVLDSVEERDAVAELTVGADGVSELTFAVEADNRTMRSLGPDMPYSPAIEVIIGVDEPTTGKRLRNWSAIRYLRVGGAHIKSVELDNFSRRLVAFQTPILENLNVRPVYVSSHGGLTNAQNFGDYIPSKKERTDRLAMAIEMDRRPYADEPGTHAFHSDLLIQLGTEVIWPQTWNSWRLHTQFHDETTPVLTEWSSSGLLGSWRTKLLRMFDEVTSKDEFGEAVVKLLGSATEAEFSEIYRECFERAGLKRYVVPGHGSMIPLLLAVSFNSVRQGETVEHMWYTHFGTHRDGRSEETTPDSPFTDFCTAYWVSLAELAYGTGPFSHCRAWTPAVGVYLRYKIATQFLEDAISIIGNEVRVEQRSVEATGRVLPDLGAGTRDLHGLTIYVDRSHEASLVVGRKRLLCFSRNSKDETGRESITILNDHCPTPLLDRLPAREIGVVETVNAEFYDLADVGEGRFVLKAAGENPVLRLRPYSLHLWNTSHLALRYRIFGTGELSVKLFMEGGRVVQISKHPPSTGGAGSWWPHEAIRDVDEYWHPTGSLEILEHLEDDQRLPIPTGKVEAIEFLLEGISTETQLELEWIRAYRAMGDGMSRDGHLIVGGRVYGPEGPLTAAPIHLTDEQGRRWDTQTDHHGNWLVDGLASGSIVEISSTLGESTEYPVSGRYVDLRKNEVEIDFVLKK